MSLILGTLHNVVIPAIFTLAFIVFIYGSFRTFIMGAHSEEVKEDGKNLMLYAMVVFFLLLVVWGLSTTLLSPAAPSLIE